MPCLKFLNRILLVLCLVVGTAFSVSIHSQEAEGLSESDLKALQETQELLKNPSLRQEYLKENPDAAKTDQNIRSLGGNKENTEELYSISADIAAILVQKSGGDTAKMQLMLQEALKNPDAFADVLSPSQLQRIKSVANKIDAEQVKKP